LNTPVQKIKKNKPSTTDSKSPAALVPEPLIQELLNMGFSHSQAEGSLKKCDNNLERAVDYLFSHPDENFDNQSQIQIGTQINPLHEVKEINKENSPVYDLYAFITHLGRNTSHGHYVCHIKKGNDWIYYNDSRVTIADEPPLHKGYIYFYRNKK
jgi:ubiquitin carboxyl-terminal hydrolase 5/13